jgi:hypothetical protein
MKVTISIFLFFISTCVYPGYYNILGARSGGLGRSSVALSGFWAGFNNQAALADYNKLAAGIYYENRFIVKEMSLAAGGFILPTKSGNFGVSLTYFGYSNYNEKKIGLGYGRKFGKSFSAGVQLDYLSTYIAEDYGKKNIITFELGFKASIGEFIEIAGHLFNPIPVYVQKESYDRIPTVFAIGASYHISKELFITLEAEKNSEFKPLIRGGIEYQIINQVAVRIGYSTLPSQTGSTKFSIASLYTFGFSLNFDKFDIDFSSSYHNVLGWSPSITAIFKFN